MLLINRIFNDLKKGDIFYKSYYFGNKVTPPSPYVVFECHQKENYIMAYDTFGDRYRFTKSEFVA